MLAVLLIWLYIFIVTTIAGFILNTSLFNSYKSLGITPNPILLSITGYCLITCFLGIFSLFYKVALEANLIIISIELLICRLYKKEFILFINLLFDKIKKTTTIQYSVFIIVLFNVLLMNIKNVPYDSDTGLYHAQAIQWIEKYPAIPGLGNLFANYAFNSSCFLSSALFSFTFIHDFPYHVLNSFFVLMLVVFALQQIHKNSSYSIIYALIIVLSFYFFRADMSLPYPDLMVAVMELFILFIYLEKVKNGSLEQYDFNSMLITLLVFTCITAKLSAIPVVFTLLLIIGYAHKTLKSKQWIYIFSSGIVIILPWLIRNVILSGYLIFPYPQIDLFNVDWKVPYSEALIAKSWIVSHARLFELQDEFKMTFNEWFPIWKGNQERMNMIILITSIAGISFLSFLMLFNRKIKNLIHLPLILFGITYLLAIFCWFLMAPTFRFGFGFMFVCLSISIFMVLNIFNLNQKRIYTGTFVFLLLFGLYCSSWPAKMLISGEINFHQHLINPEIKYKPVKCIQKDLNGLIVSLPIANKRCWNEPVPCTPRLYNKIKLRGKDLSSGFKIENTDSLVNSEYILN